MISILYVDDETGLLELGKIFLEESGGFRVDTAPSAQQALDLLAGNRYDAVISDFQMPDMDGIAFLRHIRSHNASLPVILFTGKGREEVVIDAINNGADYYIEKGGEPSEKFAELRQKVGTAVDRVRAEQKVHHFNRLYAVMSGVNAAVLHTRTREELFDQVCRILVDEGKFVGACIGLLDPEKDVLVPAAARGFDDLQLPPVPVTPAAPVLPGTLSGKVAFGRKRAILNDCAGPAYGTTPGGSTAAFPIWFHNSLLGTLQVYDRDREFFLEDETLFLEQICSDISFAVETLEADEQRERTERALAESEEKFRILVEESLVGVYILKGDRFIHVNPKFAEITGYSTEELLTSVPVDRLVAPESAGTVTSGIEQRLSGEIKSLHYTFRGVRKDGSLIDLEAAGTRVVYRGEPIIIGTIMDITERKRAEAERAQKIEELSVANQKIRAAEERLWAHIAALTESQERLNESERRMTDIINFLPDATFVIDNAGTVLVWNRAIERLTGIPSTEILGRGDYAYAIPFYHERCPVLADLVLKYDETTARRYDLVQKDGDRLMAKIYLPHFNPPVGFHAWFVAAPLYDVQGNITGAIETIRDITEFEEVRYALRTSTDHYRDILRETGEGVLISRAGRIVYSNPGIRIILGGYTGEEILGRSLEEMVVPSDRAAVRARHAPPANGAACLEPVRFRVRTKDGATRCLESRSVVIDWEGEPAVLSFLTVVPGLVRTPGGIGSTAL